MRIKTTMPCQVFNDGICQICTVENIAGKGNMPKKGLKVMESRVPYEKRLLGIGRFYDASREKVVLEQLIRIPEAFNVSTQDICILNGMQYGIHQVQSIQDVTPKAKDLSLKRIEDIYEFAGI